MGFVLNVPDHAQYLSWYTAFQSELLIPNRLTPEPNPPLFFNLLWLLLGRFGLYTKISYVGVYQIFRWISGILFAVMVYIIVAWFFPTARHRKIAFLTIFLGSGLGWILVIMKYTITRGELLFPLDLYIAEGNSFLSLMAYPHFLEASAFILLTFWLLLVGEKRRGLKYPVFAGIVAFLLGWQHGYDLIIVWGIPLAYVVTRWLVERALPIYWIKAMALVIMISCPPALYSMWLTRNNPLWEKVLAQFANAGVYTPSPPHMVIFMGIPLILAIVSFLLCLRGKWQKVSREPSERKMIFLCTWFVVGWSLCYLPTDFQIHMINSWQVPIGLLATIGLLDYILPGLRPRFGKKISEIHIVAFFLISIIPTNVYLLAWRFVDLSRYDYPYYIYQSEYQALEWLRSNAPPDSVVMSAIETGQFIPGISGKRSFLGHWAQTVDFYAKREMVREIFDQQTTDERRAEILKRYAVNYVFWGPAERKLGQYVPDHSPFLNKIYETDQVKIYLVSIE